MSIFKLETTTLSKASHSSFSWQENNQQKYILFPDYQSLLQILETLQAGILILSITGEIIHANVNAVKMSAKINGSNCEHLPSSIWQLCKSMLEHYQGLAIDTIFADEIILNHQESYRISARFLDLESHPIPYILVTIENPSESIKNIVIAEIKQYQLTPREAEIWQLYRTDHSYKDIATKLYITINTVKKHMKNIHAKRQAFLANRCN